MKIHYAGYQPNASGFGWATCNAALVRELDRRNVLYHGPSEVTDTIGRFLPGQGNTQSCFSHEYDVVFMPLINHKFEPASTARGKVNLAYTFFESPLEPEAVENARNYHTIFAGSIWCLERMAEKGITNTELLIQGVDHEIFRPQPPRKPDGQFRIFSGGKFEYRKGQDLVIAAFKEFAKNHSDAHLVCNWFNPWPHLITASLPYIEWIKTHFIGETQADQFAGLMVINGIDKSQFTILPQLRQMDLAAEMANTDIGLFPNRCEGGTNLVLMEYASCGRHVVANALTGHADVDQAIAIEIPATHDEKKWAVQKIEIIAEALQMAYAWRSLPAPTVDGTQWSWSTAAETIIAEARRFL